MSLTHWTGMWAVRVKGGIGYQAGPVQASLATAVVAATVALWFTATVNDPGLRVLAGLVTGAAVTGMRYVGMSAVYVRLDPAGVEVFTFLFPVFVVGAGALAVPIAAAPHGGNSTPNAPFVTVSVCVTL